MSDDPVRLDLSGDAPADAIEALRLARSDAPAAARLAAIEAGVASKMPAGGGGGGSGLALKAGAAVGVTAAVVVAVVLATRSSPPPPPPPAPEAAPPPSLSAPPHEPEPTTLSVNDLPSATVSAAPKPAPIVEDEGAEVALLDRAQASLATSPADTLARCDEHARRFPNGSLAQEREVLAIDALVRLGRRDEAEKRAARFRQAYPKSAQLRRVEALLAR